MTYTPIRRHADTPPRRYVIPRRGSGGATRLSSPKSSPYRADRVAQKPEKTGTALAVAKPWTRSSDKEGAYGCAFARPKDPDARVKVSPKSRDDPSEPKSKTCVLLLA